MRTSMIDARRSRVQVRAAWACLLSVLTFMLACAPGCVTPEPEPTVTPKPQPDCVDFEGLSLGTRYHVPDRFMDSDVEMTARAFQWGTGEWTTDGFTEVDDEGRAGGSGQEMWINNVNLDFDFCCVVEGLSLRFGEYGGNLNIAINGVFQNFDDFVDIDGANVGGVTVAVTDGLGNDTGILTLKGEIWSFALGGQELWIDDVCHGGCLPGPEVVDCVDFEDPPLGAQYEILDSFQDSGAVIRVAAFQWGGGEWTTGGYAEVADGGLAGGSGQEMWINNVNLDFKLARCPFRNLVIYFGEYGGNVNLYINEEFRESDDLMDLDGQVIGGVEVTVVDGYENEPAMMELMGEIRSFAIGGQELAIDGVCPWVE